MYNKVELCGVNTAELPILSEQEKRDLLTRARAGDKKARQSMIEGNLRLVLSVVQRFSQRGENMDDLFQVGCIGLIKAIDNFMITNQSIFFSHNITSVFFRCFQIAQPQSNCFIQIGRASCRERVFPLV